MPIALLRIPDPKNAHNICVLGIHAPPPLPVDATGMIPYIDYLDDRITNGTISEDWLVCSKGDLVLLIGDLNAVPGSFPYGRLLNMGLRDVRSWSGIWGATWPMEDFYWPFPVFRLDQILVGGDLELKGWESVPISNSDHRGLRVWF
jgi:endonuclease/exonuclease/phosphatase (EEP) superfamily protein YafD